MRILITGGTGIIGKKLTGKLKELDYELRLLVFKSELENIKNGNLEIAVGDLSDPASLRQATSEVDIVIHLAAITHTNNQELYLKVNTEGTKNLIRACEDNQVTKFIFVSSRTASEEGGAYAYSKLLAEKEVEQSKLDWVILRIAEVYWTVQALDIVALDFVEAFQLSSLPRLCIASS